MADVADRVQSILDELKISARELARRAGLKSESHVGLIVKRTVTRPSADVLHAIARAAEVEPRWLESGEGPRSIKQVVRMSELVTNERYAAMPAVRSMARAQGFDEAFVGTWEVHLDADDQPDADYLWTLCKADYARWARKGKGASTGDALAGLDDEPMRPARKKR